MLCFKMRFNAIISVDIATRLQAVRHGIQTPSGARDLSNLQNVQTGSGTHLAFYLVCTGCSFLGVKAAES